MALAIKVQRIAVIFLLVYLYLSERDFEAIKIPSAATLHLQLFEAQESSALRVVGCFLANSFAKTRRSLAQHTQILERVRSCFSIICNRFIAPA
jgi:hypothetical protein